MGLGKPLKLLAKPVQDPVPRLPRLDRPQGRGPDRRAGRRLAAVPVQPRRRRRAARPADRGPRGGRPRPLGDRHRPGRARSPSRTTSPTRARRSAPGWPSTSGRWAPRTRTSTSSSPSATATATRPAPCQDAFLSGDRAGAAAARHRRAARRRVDRLHAGAAARPPGRLRAGRGHDARRGPLGQRPRAARPPARRGRPWPLIRAGRAAARGHRGLVAARPVAGRPLRRQAARPPARLRDACRSSARSGGCARRGPRSTSSCATPAGALPCSMWRDDWDKLDVSLGDGAQVVAGGGAGLLRRQPHLFAVVHLPCLRAARGRRGRPAGPGRPRCAACSTPKACSPASARSRGRCSRARSAWSPARAARRATTCSRGCAAAAGPGGSCGASRRCRTATPRRGSPRRCATSSPTRSPT